MFLWEQLALSGTAVATATIFTHPIDVVKVRLQVEAGSAAGMAFSLPRFAKTFSLVAHERRLYSGLSPAVMRAFLYGGFEGRAWLVGRPTDPSSANRNQNYRFGDFFWFVSKQVQ
eukprot:GEMP01042020.1.p1 GENE.GEMP01042020.1~~GEMP01042020.1.p1  ORF type:complete len:115 (+),score=18.65 GEMP01042020.1:64-408(+)